MGSQLVDPAKLLMRKNSSDPDLGVIAPFDQFIPSFTGRLHIVLHGATGTPFCFAHVIIAHVIATSNAICYGLPMLITQPVIVWRRPQDSSPSRRHTETKNIKHVLRHPN